MTAAADAHRIRRLGVDDVDAYCALREHSFGYPDDDATRTVFAGRMPSMLGAFDAAGSLVASASGHRLETFVAGDRRGLLGVAAVQTAPSARRRGVARRLMTHLLGDARDDGVGWSMLYPFDPRFYERLGWQSLPTGVRLRLPTSALGPPARTDATALTGPLRPALQPIYERCAPLWNFTNARTTGPWDAWEELQPERGRRTVAFALPDAYAVHRLRADDAATTTLEVHDALWCSAAGREALLSLLRSYQGQAEMVELEVPRDDALAWAWADWHATATHATRMVRVVDVAAALAGLPLPPDAAPVRVRVHDVLAPWNAGTWRLSARDARCAVTRVTGGADARVDVRAVTLLVSGAATPAAVERAGMVRGDARALRTLASLSAGLTPYHALSDRF